MKTCFSLTKRFVPVWRDNDKADAAEQLVAVFSMPSISDIFIILDALSSNGIKQGEETNAEALPFTAARNIVKQAGHFLPTYVKLENAEDFTIEDVVKYPPYFPLANELLFALIEYAQPKDADVKNSKGLPA